VGSEREVWCRLACSDVAGGDEPSGFAVGPVSRRATNHDHRCVGTARVIHQRDLTHQMRHAAAGAGRGDERVALHDTLDDGTHRAGLGYLARFPRCEMEVCLKQAVRALG